MNYSTRKVIKGPTEIEFSAMLNMNTPSVSNYFITIGKFNWGQYIAEGFDNKQCLVKIKNINTTLTEKVKIFLN